MDKIIAAVGCVVPDLNFRTGKRYVNASLVVVGDGEVVSSPKKSPKKLLPIHPDAQIALDDIKKKRKRTDRII